MITSKKYNLINNVGGWAMFVIALATYWLTLEPTASYWDCGEFIIQADKLEIGHPPGNPIFMLAARFFANFASDASQVALMVNAMSGLLSALTILLLFWTITHLVRRLVIKDGQTEEPSLRQYLAIMGSGVVGALAYAWSDTFWFSAVEAEVYAFSSFCTALVFWLILKWESRADEPHSDRYLVLIAYVIGVSVAVHLLNLLCIPAIVLVFAYRKFDNMNLKRSLIALLASFGIIVAVLYGLVPGFIKVASWFELMAVNSWGMSFNSGTMIYTVLTIVLFAWSIIELNRQQSAMRIRISLLAAVAISGLLFFGSTPWIGLVLLAVLAGVLFVYFKKNLPVRVLNVCMWSIAVIFIGYSSYALILIRSNADTPMNQNSPDNVFALSSYLNREQYGDRPLLYGETPYSEQLKETAQIYENGNYYASYATVKKKGAPRYAKGISGAVSIFPSGYPTANDSLNNDRLDRRGGDYYALADYNYDIETTSELKMLFPRIYSSAHIPQYEYWAGMDKSNMDYETVTVIDAATGERIPETEYYYNENGEPAQRSKVLPKPTFAQNLRYFFDYQINHMYMRYFMWNFVGRQNDICNQQGELDAGNWISGIPFIDDARLGDQSLLPEDFGKGNKGHNVFYMLPLILGLIGLIWQAFAGRRGIEHFWIVFFLFFMTGIAIVIYLNQTPSQPRERDYAFAGSFYAFAIWIGVGVAGLWRTLMWLIEAKKNSKKDNQTAANDEELQPSSIVDEPESKAKMSTYCAIAACVLGLFVPLQMVSQTWDDHDRTDRTMARDFAINYLESLEPNAIVFCNGDNDTFPLWYAQEVEGVRPDVRIINLSYLASDWYANQQRMQAYDSAPVEFLAQPKDYAYDRLTYAQIINPINEPTEVLESLRSIYDPKSVYKYGTSSLIELKHPNMYIPVDSAAVVKAGLVSADDPTLVDRIDINLTQQGKQYLTQSEILMLDIIATNAANGWKRPIYWASTVPNSYHLGLTPYMKSVGMVYQLLPTRQLAELPARTDKAYDVVTKKYRWGGTAMNPYIDETAGRMLSSVRSSMTRLTAELIYEGDNLKAQGDTAAADKKYRQALEVLDLIEKNLPQSTKRYSIFSEGMDMGMHYAHIGAELGDDKVKQKGLTILEGLLKRAAGNYRYAVAMQSLFRYPSLTYENHYIPYYLKQFIDDYEGVGGDVDKLMKSPEMAGITLEQLDTYRNQLSSSSSEEMTEEQQALQILSELASQAADINRYAAMSAEEYANLSDIEREADSLFYLSLQFCGLDQEILSQYEEFKDFDFARAKRLSDEYIRNNPEIAEELQSMM